MSELVSKWKLFGERSLELGRSGRARAAVRVLSFDRTP